MENNKNEIKNAVKQQREAELPEFVVSGVPTDEMTSAALADLNRVCAELFKRKTRRDRASTDE